jgi:hypothetical protein
LELLHSKVSSPSVSGIVAMAVSAMEDRLVVAREDGSLLLFKLDFFQNVCHLVRIASTGGRRGRSIRGVHFVLEGMTILVTHLSGQYVLYDADTLIPTAMLERTGGPILASCVVARGRIAVAAIADGTLHVVSVSSRKRLDLVAVAPKVSGANRSLCVSASAELGLAVGGDDAGHVTCWEFSAVLRHVLGNEEQKEKEEEEEKRGNASFLGSGRGGGGNVSSSMQQRWSTRLGTALPLSALLLQHDMTSSSTVGCCCVIGTSVGEVVVMDVTSGSVVSSFCHHKGPVTVLARGADLSSFLASG